ncbi:MAG: hypothetical protein AB8B78_13630, partial [Polaribacter sp.]
MKKFVCLLILSFLTFSCSKKKISNLPFEVNHNITCDDLYNIGYKRTFGVDVILIGKIMNDTIIHYQIDVPPVDYVFDYDNIEENITDENDTITNATIYDKYLEKDALELNDSIYEFVWGSLKQQQKDICKEGLVSWRNFMLELKETETKSFRSTIDTNKFKVLDVEKESNYPIDEFKVVNLVTKDTFDCSIY